LLYNAEAFHPERFKRGVEKLSAAERKAPGEQQGASSWEQTGEREISNFSWTIASAAILLVGALLRIYDLALKPLHHDEGVNGFFLQRLVKEGVYTYDPANYHGPTLYYFSLVSTSLNSFFHGGSGLSTIAVRLVPALFGVATIWLILCLRRYIGSTGTLVAAALLSLSPGAVYMSRYFIHESLFVFFTLGIVVAWLKYYDHQPSDEAREELKIVVLPAAVLLIISTLGAVYQPAFYSFELILLLIAFVALVASLWLYDGERATYLILGSISAALMYATKETAVISAGVLLIAVSMSIVYLRLRRPPIVEAKKKKQKWQQKRSGSRSTVGVRLRASMERFGGPLHVAVLLFAALALFLMVSVVFYSSFFKNKKGVADAIETFKIWTKTGLKDHTSPWYKFRYAKWMSAEESPLLLVGGAGILLAVRRGTNRFAVFAALWAFGIIAAYSLIPYKTPWLMLSFIVPLAIIGGYGVETFYRQSKDFFERLLIVALTVASLGVGAYQTVSLNFFHYDDENYVYVYAHTVREFLPLVDEIKRVSKLAGTGTETGITVVSPDYWPLPWYLRDYSKVGYFGRLSASSEPLIICSEQQEAELKTTYLIDERYQRLNFYPLRPGVTLVLYARRDVLAKQPDPATTTTQ
jgi:uncharacterized protein (TIGR03663 family)